MALNYEEENKKITSNKNAAINEVDQRYGEMIGGVDKNINDQIDASKDYAEEQKKNQQAQTDFTIDKINQQKDQARKDYTKEQSGAYVDWQKQSNPYGANAEKMASMGMAGTGYSESSQVNMYVAYQNRVAAARESYDRAVLNYNNSITEARLQNNSVLAEIAYKALQDQLELSLQGFQYKNTLLMEKAKEKRTIESEYHNRWKDLLSQINAEKSLELQERQVKLSEDQFAYQKQKDAEAKINKTGSTSSRTTARTASRAANAKSSKSTISANKGSATFTGTTYDAAVAYMEKNGVPSSYASGIMTKSEWSRRKGSYSYSTYEAYLKDVVAYNIEQNANKSASSKTNLGYKGGVG